MRDADFYFLGKAWEAQRDQRLSFSLSFSLCLSGHVSRNVITFLEEDGGECRCGREETGELKWVPPPVVEEERMRRVFMGNSINFTAFRGRQQHRTRWQRYYVGFRYRKGKMHHPCRPLLLLLVTTYVLKIDAPVHNSSSSSSISSLRPTGRLQRRYRMFRNELLKGGGGGGGQTSARSFSSSETSAIWHRKNSTQSCFALIARKKERGKGGERERVSG